MNILTAPLQSLYSLNFYKAVLRSPLRKGFLYLLYLTAIMAIIFQLMLAFQLMPQAAQFVEWFKAEMPEITWTPEKISISETSPYTMFHPEMGPLIVFNTTVDTIMPDQMGEAFVYVTAKKAYARRGEGEVRVYDLIEADREAVPAEPASVFIGPTEVQGYYDMAKPWIYVVTFLFMFPAFYFWKLLTALFYSLIALLFNLMRTVKLSYSQLLNLSFFVITPSTLIQILKPLIPGLNAIPFGLPASLVLTSLYLFFTLKKTEEIPSA